MSTRYPVNFAPRSAQVILSITLFCSALFSQACARRTIAITSEPQGALVWVNDEQVGRTPLEIDFKYFGLYDVRLRLEGYDPISQPMNAPTPLLEQPGLDLAGEALSNRTLIKWHFNLTQSTVAINQAKGEADLLERASQFKNQQLPQQQLQQPDQQPAN
jgi:hypothetical protein